VVDSDGIIEDLRRTTLKLLAYCRDNNWAGYDPYDALNSGLLRSLGLDNSRLSRLLFTQFLKRSPFNFRPLLRIPKTQNPKAIALFLMAFLKLSRLGLLEHNVWIPSMVDKLEALRSDDSPYRCWGYSFPWQTRTVLVPRGTPNIVCTVFAANALLDTYEYNQDQNCLAMARHAAEYLLHTLYWEGEDSSAGFSYPLPSLTTHIHNANFLGAALLCRVYHHTGDKNFVTPAFNVARHSASKQNDDGSWYYGEAPGQNWIDNFHTAYNLMALRDIQRYGETLEFASRIAKGFAFYRNHLFGPESVPRYYHAQTYPVDTHCIANSLITLLTFAGTKGQSIEGPIAIFKWAMNHMWDEHGFFYYQSWPLYTNKISYIRWSQAWMLLALSAFMEQLVPANKKAGSSGDC